jgi:hypothetical protein
MRQVEIHQEVFITVVVGWVTEHVSVMKTKVAVTLYHTEQVVHLLTHVQVLEITVTAAATVLYVLNSSKVNPKIQINTVSGELSGTSR